MFYNAYKCILVKLIIQNGSNEPKNQLRRKCCSATFFLIFNGATTGMVNILWPST